MAERDATARVSPETPIAPSEAPTTRRAGEVLRNEINWPAVAALGAAVVFTVGFLFLYSTPPLVVLWYLLVFVFTVTGPGTLVWRAIVPRREGTFLDLAFGTGVGTLLQLGFWFCFVGLGIGQWILLGPAALYLVFLAVPRLRRHWRATPGMERLPAGIAAGLAGGYALMLVIFSSAFALALPPKPNDWYVDQYWHLGNAAGLLTRTHSIDMRVASQDLVYHWFSSAHIAGQTLASGLDLSLVLARLWIVPIFAAIALLAVAVGKQLTGRWWPGLLLGLMMSLTAEVDLTGVVLPANSPIHAFSGSQTYAMVVFLLTLGVLIRLWQRRGLAPGEWVLLALCLLASPGAKSAILPVLICGLALGLVVSLWRRRSWKPMGIPLLMSCAALAITMPFLGGGEAGVRVQLLATVRQTAFYNDALGLTSLERQFSRDFLPPYLLTATGLTAAAVVLLAYVVANSWLVLGVPALRRDDDGHEGGWVLLGTGVAGLSAMMLIDHDGMSQLYFFRTGIVGWYLLAAWGLQRLWEASAPAVRHKVLAAGIVAGVLATSIGRAALYRLIAAEHPLRSLLLCLLLLLVPAAAAWGAWAFARGQEARSAVLAFLGVALAAASVSAAASLPNRSSFPELSAWAVTTDEYTAARWVRDHTDPDDVVATNVHCRGNLTTQPCDNRSFWVSGFTQRPVLIEGWAYTHQAHTAHGVNDTPYVAQPFHDQALFALNEAAFSAPTAEGLAELSTHGVRYLFAAHSRGPISPDLAGLATEVYSNDDVTVYALD
ncbi:MAG TPA: hypothetical protein PKE40_02145 [Arachnia sp.]|nr:hypothetical protein [Arachnia sp.]HMT85131.1 hypothetical protein [Arachnia sp.]